MSLQDDPITTLLRGETTLNTPLAHRIIDGEFTYVSTLSLGLASLTCSRTVTPFRPSLRLRLRILLLLLFLSISPSLSLSPSPYLPIFLSLSIPPSLFLPVLPPSLLFPSSLPFLSLPLPTSPFPSQTAR